MEELKKTLSADPLKEQELIKSLKRSKVNEKEISSFLRNNYVDLNKLDKDGYNCLHYAIKTENPDIVNLLLTINTEEDENAKKDLLTSPANPNISTNDSKKEIFLHPLHFANQEVNDPQNSAKIIKILIKYGADASKVDDFKCNILHRAAEKGNIDLVSYILERHPYLLNVTSKYGSILHMAVASDNTNLVESILQSTLIDLSLEDYVKNSAMHLAIISKSSNCFKQILDFIKNSTVMPIETKHKLINQKNEDGNTLLHELAYSKSSVLIDYMNKLDESIRINPEEKNNKGHTYRDIQKDIIKMIKEKEDEDKRRREAIRQEKQRFLEEKKKLEAEMALEAEKQAKKEEESRLLQEKLVRFRGPILILLFIFFMFVLYFLIQNKINKKKEGVVL